MSDGLTDNPFCTMRSARHNPFSVSAGCDRGDVGSAAATQRLAEKSSAATAAAIKPLLAALIPHIGEEQQTVSAELHDGQAAHQTSSGEVGLGRRRFLIVDGYEPLSRWRRFSVAARPRAVGACWSRSGFASDCPAPANCGRRRTCREDRQRLHRRTLTAALHRSGDQPLFSPAAAETCARCCWTISTTSTQSGTVAALRCPGKPAAGGDVARKRRAVCTLMSFGNAAKAAHLQQDESPRGSVFC